MHHISIEIPIAAVAAAMMASIVFIAGTALASRGEEIVSYTAQPTLCTVSYCEPASVQETASAAFWRERQAAP